MRKVYKSCIPVLALVMLFMTAVGQDRVVTGTVKDPGGANIPGVNVIIKGTSNGTTTDSDGKYSISTGQGTTLLFSFIGFVTQEVPVGTQSVVDVTLIEDVAQLTEVVVTGYSVDKRRELTGAVSTVKAADLTFAPTGNVEQLLQGRVAGVTVITNGQPGSTSQIRIRGFGSFGGNAPLYIVDGVPVDNTSFLNPDDIETTTVLKDAASASIYGARAASGVVIYTTKKGKKGGNGKLNVTYDLMTGVTTPGNGIDMLNPTDFADYTWKAIKNTEDANAAAFVDPVTGVKGRPVDYAKALAGFNHPQFGAGASPVIPNWLRVGGQNGAAVGSANIDLNAQKLLYNVDPRNGPIYNVFAPNRGGTDWYKEITRVAPVIRQTIGFNGGGEKYRFYVGLSGQDQQGILMNNSFKRYALRSNNEFDVLKNLRIGSNLQFTYRQALGQTGRNGGIGGADEENDILSAFRMPSIIPVHNAFGGYAGTAAGGFNNPRNPVATREGLANDRNHGTSGFGNIYMEFDPIPGLTLRTSIGGNYNSSSYRFYGRWQYENSENNSAFTYGQGSAFNFGWTFTNTASYSKKFGEHSIDVLAGQEALNTGHGWNLDATGLNPFSWDPNFVNLTQTSSRVVNSSQFKGVNFYSLFGRVNYAFKQKYIASFVVRRDGSSRFGSNNRYGVFPAASVAWRISDEGFMQGLTMISDFKIRGGFGSMGNSNNVDPNNQFSLYGGNLGNSSYDINGSNSSAATGFYRTRIGNPNAKWETSVTKNIGIDGNLFGGKLDVIIDFWQKDTKDLLLDVPITAAAGPNASPPSVNIAKMVNKGIDIALTNKGNITTDLKYEVTVNGSFLKNEISAIAPGLNYITTINPGYRGITPIRNGLNQPISSFYGYQVQGLFKNAEEVNSAATQAGAAPGRFRYKDINGDGKIDPSDRTFIGSPVPKFTGGINFVFRYKSFDLTAYTYMSMGNKLFNVSRWFTDFYPSFQGAAISARVKDSWTPTNTGATIPIFESASNFSTNTQSSSFYVEKGNYLRMQNITLGYNMPMSVLSKIGVTKLRIFVATNNVFTITKYSGLDPGVGGAADTTFGIDVGNYPVTRSFTGGLNLAF